MPTLKLPASTIRYIHAAMEHDQHPLRAKFDYSPERYSQHLVRTTREEALGLHLYVDRLATHYYEHEAIKPLIEPYRDREVQRTLRLAEKRIGEQLHGEVGRYTAKGYHQVFDSPMPTVVP